MSTIATQTTKKLAVIGNGMTGMRTVEELLKIAPDKYEITVFGTEPHPNYNRILLSPVLAGEQTIKDILLNDWDWYKGNGINLITGKTITDIHRTRRELTTDTGEKHNYDRLLVATGSNPFILPIDGNKLPRVISYRDIADTEAMIDAAKHYNRAVVIGGGLLGLEAANGLKLRGMDVTVVHVMPWLMERQLDEKAGKLLQGSLEAKGIKFRMQAQTEALIAGESGRVAALRFKGGEQIPADRVVMAVGIRPKTALAEKSGLQVSARPDGIIVNDTTSAPTPTFRKTAPSASSLGCGVARRQRMSCDALPMP